MVRRNIKEPGCRMVCHNRDRPRRPVLPSCFGVPVAVLQACLLDALLPQLPLLLPACPSSTWGLSRSPSVMPSTVAPSSPAQFPPLRKNVTMTCSLARRSSKAVAPSIWISGIPPPPLEHASSLHVDPGTWSRQSWWSTRSTATRFAPTGVCRAKSRLRCQSTSGFLHWNQGNPETKSLARLGTTSTSDSRTCDNCSIQSTVNAVFRHSFAWAIAWPLMPRVVMYVGWCARPSCVRTLGAIKMLVALLLMRARTCCISPLPSNLEFSWIIWDVSGLDLPHTFWLDVKAFGLSNNTPDFKAIRCGCTLSIVAIKVCIANVYNPKSMSSILSCWAICGEGTMSLFVVDCRRTSVV